MYVECKNCKWSQNFWDEYTNPFRLLRIYENDILTCGDLDKIYRYGLTYRRLFADALLEKVELIENCKFLIPEDCIDAECPECKKKELEIINE